MTLTAIILAGGNSQRMGRDKALLPLSGIPLIRRTWDVAHAVTPEVKIVTSRRERYRPYLPRDAAWIDESPPSGSVPPGPLLAFHHALTHIQTDWVLLLACDMPKLRANILTLWRQDLAELSPSAIAYLPQTERGWEPLCGFYRSSCRNALQTYLDTGRRSFQPWLDASPVVSIPDVPPAMLANCNTPDDWLRLQPEGDPE